MQETWGQKLAEWEDVVEACNLSFAGIGRRFEVAHTNLCNWFYRGVSPSKKSRVKMESIIMQLKKTKRIPFHPSYGYATPEQMEKLRSPLQEWERNKIMEQVAKQTKLRGKID